MRYSEKWPEYAKQWDSMVINPSRVKEFQQIAEYAIANKTIYQDIEGVTGVPWYQIAVIHKRESDAQDKNGNPLFTSYLGNGQPLNKRTTIVPKGRGPFLPPDAFKKGAIDALHIDALDSVLDWRLEKLLYFDEVMNGGGYSRRGLPSPYNWGGTNIQKIGKFVKDGKFNSRVMDKQPGCAPILQTIARLDTSIKFVRES